MLRFPSLPIGQVGHRQLGCFGEIVGHASEPQSFKIQQMPGMFLHRPFLVFARSPHQNAVCRPAHNFFQSRWRAAQPRTQIQMLLYRKCEFKLSFKP